MASIKYPTGFPAKQREYQLRYRRKQGQVELGSPEFRARMSGTQQDRRKQEREERAKLYFSFPLIPEEDKWAEGYIESTVDRITYQELYDD